MTIDLMLGYLKRWMWMFDARVQDGLWSESLGYFSWRLIVALC
jgi:hypothetical protein